MQQRGARAAAEPARGLPPPTKPVPEERLPAGDFEVDYAALDTRDLIGQGAFGRVYSGRWRGTEVAIKMLVCQALTAEVLDEFKREVAVMSALRHPNVVLFMGACTVAPHYCLVTELLKRGSLWGVIHAPGSERVLEWPLVLRMAMDTARGMAFLHSAKPAILHRDLKSGNLLVDDSYTIKLADFGLARVKAFTQTMTGSTGTYQWMAPEVLANQRYTEKADVYSFGIVAWELVARKCPFEGLHHIQVAVAVLREGLRPVIPGTTPTKYEAMLRRCWAPEPDKRPSFAEVLLELEGMAAGR